MKTFSKFLQKSTPPTTIIKSLWSKLFGKYLLVTNTLASGILMATGDFIQQRIERKKRYDEDGEIVKFEWERNSKMTLVGLVFGPIHHYYYTWIDRMWPKRNLGTVFKKLLADQCIMSPTCICMFFLGNAYLDRMTYDQSIAELKDKFLIVYTMDWTVWPPTQFFNFYLVPANYRVLYINFATMIYNVYLSYMKHEFQVQETAFRVQH